MRFSSAVILLLCISSLGRAETARVSLFDPARHMHIAEVRPGMKGYGLSVFSGSKIERFEVEVISVMKNFNPRGDVILIRCSGANLDHTGAIAGMSGSPIFLKDDQGRERMIGAFAYGWPLSKDPLAGVQPIEYMLDIPETKTKESEPREAGRPPVPAAEDHRPADATRLQPLATPLMVSGLSGPTLDHFTPLLEKYGLHPMQAGAGSGDPDQPAPKFEPGSVLAVPLLTGDLNLSAIGTVTEVIGDRIFGFGHPFNSEGPISLPMGTGQIHTIIPSLEMSFKLGSAAKLGGTLTADQMVGVSGKIGPTPVGIPINMRVTYADGSSDLPYRFVAALHPRMTPMLCALAVQASVTSNKELPQFHTLNYDIGVEFANGKTLSIKNIAADVNADGVFDEVAMALALMADNPFDRVMVKSIEGTVKVSNGVKSATILSGSMPKLMFHPGEVASGVLRYRPFHSTERSMAFEMPLPSDLPDGQYRLVACDWANNFSEMRMSQPFRYDTSSAADVFDLVKEMTSYRRDAVYLRLIRQADGVAFGRLAMPRLPSSRRQVMLSSGRSNVTSYTTTHARVIPTEFVMQGTAEFTITIDRSSHVENVAPKTPVPAHIKVPAGPKIPLKTEPAPRG